eukprot:scaffold80133_cov46-Prasinocladus_malaysianus.AAC.3
MKQVESYILHPLVNERKNHRRLRARCNQAPHTPSDTSTTNHSRTFTQKQYYGVQAKTGKIDSNASIFGSAGIDSSQCYI